MTRKLIPVVVLAAMAALAGPGRAEDLRVTAVRFWTLSQATRVAIEISGEFKYHAERLHNPERIFFDISQSVPSVGGKRFSITEVNDRLLKRIRVAERQPGTTRIVLDLEGATEYTVSQLANPDRLMIELRAGAKPAIPLVSELPKRTPVAPPPVEKPRAEQPLRAGSKPATPVASELPKRTPVVAPPVEKPRAEQPLRAGSKPATPVVSELPKRTPEVAPPPVEKPGAGPPLRAGYTPSIPAVVSPPDERKPVEKPPLERSQEQPLRADAAPPVLSDSPPPALDRKPAAAPSPAPVTPGETPLAARRTTDGRSSLTRALGLKVTRVVIDAGHGGHDQGTVGPRGMVEKDLVLDVALRLGKLIEERLGSEVIYTRTDDTFIPLEGRTGLANDRKADLFLSIHANSSPYPTIRGVETYYLNFTNAKDALDTAARENASSQKSIFELRDIIQKITQHDKAEESREFASRVQTALQGFERTYSPASKNRGVKKAPFVVLIGASMPSILAEIGFLSNVREENLLKRPEHRQKLAEALYQGVSKYAQSLSHFQVARAGE